MIKRKRAILPGSPYPLGATWDGHGVNFALFSAHAEKVELCLFDENGRRELERIAMPEQTHQIWHVYLPDAGPGTLYGYRVYGPYEPERGHRFNHHKLLLDPYARQLWGNFRWIEAHYGYRFGSSREDLSFDKRDNAQALPKCRVVDPAFTWDGDSPPATPWSQTVIYETHVRGFTILHEGIPVVERGTFAGMGHREVVAYLKALGITAVELMPVHAFLDEHFLVKKGLRNYWGYNTLNFFSPELRYLSRPELAEFKTMVRRLHDAGIEVILDVVYNHTAEGNQLGPTLCFRGIDNASYYWLNQDNPRYYVNDTGVGNTLNLTHPRVLQLVMDSLRYWVTEMHVDGFRFDLAVTLGRERHGFDPHSGFFDAIQHRAAISLEISRWAGRSGTITFGIRSGASGGGTRESCRISDGACWAPPTCSKRTGANRGPASISSPVTTASPWRIRSATTSGTTKPTGRTTRMATTKTSVTTMASKGRPTIRRSPPCAAASVATCWPTSCLPRGLRCCWREMNSVVPSGATTMPTARTIASTGSTGRPFLRRSGSSSTTCAT